MTDGLVNIVLSGSLAAVESALSGLSASDVNRLNKSETNALHAAVWRNHLPILDCLLAANASPDLQDGESGWTSLHHALYWGHLCAGAKLLEAGAQLHIQDTKGRTPLDLVSAELARFLSVGSHGDVYSWGNGANYQLGTGSAGLQASPARIDTLHGLKVVRMAAGKFHSVALAADGSLYTWGFGRGGRLGHPEFDIHSGESAVIVPRLVQSLGRRRVTDVAAAKHHTAILTDQGEVYTWGSNRDGRLGYTAVDTQPTPRRISTLRQRMVRIAAANKHTVAVSDAGLVFSWGSNCEGQLGYGTSDSTSNAVPRIVEAVKGKRVVAAAAAKRHTVVLTGDGDVFTWGHRVVTPRRVQLSGWRDTARAAGGGASSGGGWEVVFHKGQGEVARPHAAAIAAGAAHSCCLTQAGTVLAWSSADPALGVQMVGGRLVGKRVVSISAGKDRTAVVTDEGDVYMWEASSKLRDRPGAADRISGGADSAQTASQPTQLQQQALPRRPSFVGEGGGAGKAAAGSSSKGASHEGHERGGAGGGGQHRRSKPRTVDRIVPERVEGLKRAVAVCVGEKHSLALQGWCAAPLLPERPSRENSSAASASGSGAAVPDLDTLSEGGGSEEGEGEGGGAGERGEEAYWEQLERSCPDGGPGGDGGRVPSLQRLCERAVAVSLVEPRTVLQILAYADAASLHMLHRHCCAVALCNLDAVLLEARGALEALPPHLLQELEALQREHLCGAGGVNRRPTAADDALGCDDMGEEAALDADALRLAAGQALAAAQGGGEAVGAAAAAVGPTAESWPASERSFHDKREAAQAAERSRQVRYLRRKLQQIEGLERRSAEGSELDPQQQAKIGQRGLLQAALDELEGGGPLEKAQELLRAAQEKVEAVRSASATPAAESSFASSGPFGSLPKGEKLSQRKQPPTPGSASASATPFGSSPPSAYPSSEALPGSSPPGVSPRGPLSYRVTVGWGAAQAVGTPPSKAVPEGWVEAAGLTPQAAAQRATGTANRGTPTPAAAARTPAASWANVATPSPGPRPTPTPPAKTSGGRASRRGGLSMFLAGELDSAAATQSPQLAGSSAAGPMLLTPPGAGAAGDVGPRWGAGLGLPMGGLRASLREIQDEEAAAASAAARERSTGRPRPRESPSRSDLRAILDSPSAPPPDTSSVAAPGSARVIPLARLLNQPGPVGAGARGGGEKEKERERERERDRKAAGPAWGAAALGTAPQAIPKPSLKDIQEEQEKLRESLSRSWGAAGASPGSSRAANFFAHTSSWRSQSTAVNAPPAGPGAAAPGATAGAAGGGGGAMALLGSSPGSLFPAAMGSSPGGSRGAGFAFGAAPPQGSKWYIPEERPVVPLVVIQSEESIRAQEAAAEAAAEAAENPKDGENPEDATDRPRRRRRPRRTQDGEPGGNPRSRGGGGGNPHWADGEEGSRRQRGRRPEGIEGGGEGVPGRGPGERVEGVPDGAEGGEAGQRRRRPRNRRKPADRGSEAGGAAEPGIATEQDGAAAAGVCGDGEQQPRQKPQQGRRRGPRAKPGPGGQIVDALHPAVDGSEEQKSQSAGAARQAVPAGLGASQSRKDAGAAGDR